MLATALSATLVGIAAHPVAVEVQVVRGPPFFEIVGLPEAAVRESRVRVKSALAHVGVDIAECRVVVSLSPADLRKTGSGFDLAIAAAALGAYGAVPVSALEGALLVGELALDGKVHGLRGILAHVFGARARAIGRVVVPRANAAEAALVQGIDVRTVASLQQLVDALRGRSELARPAPFDGDQPDEPVFDLAEVKGQATARRALEVSAAGQHHLLLVGPPGAGKTMLARRLPGILPRLTSEEALEVTAIHSVAGLLSGKRRVSRSRPFRAPHHTVSDVGLVGGGEGPRPGEISLAHRGVLFLDELAEFRRASLEALRQPLEDGTVTITRATARATFPAAFLLVGSSNPCRCGYLGDGSGRCSCSAERVRAYREKLSGPLVDRIDVHVVMPPVDVAALHAAGSGEPTSAVRARVVAAHAIQRERFARGEVRVAVNAALGPRDLDRVAAPCPAGVRMLASAVERLALSARAYGKVLRVARTIADLEGAAAIAPVHIAEAISFRVLDRRVADAAA